MTIGPNLPSEFAEDLGKLLVGQASRLYSLGNFYGDRTISHNFYR